ncbi:enoyl-CoA hydratase/isomerase family protein [Corynebacterium diphtheriae]|nr:enoyl-CoA hydratase/isomerase family protein [Corynebacterium diphtheriae]
MNNKTSAAPVRAYVENSTGVLELNRPQALNSLTHEMVNIIDQALDQWWDDDAVHRVLVYSNSPKAFCAGGDVRAAREAIQAGRGGEADQFFVDEYDMNNNISEFPKPYISLIDGFVMGGGLGLSAHGSHRVISEKASAAMPEMAIGFTPDVGMAYMFQRMTNATGSPSHALATFLVTTGWRMTAADMIWSGLATDIVPSADHDLFRETVYAESLDEALERYSVDTVGDSELATLLLHIEKTFGFPTWAQINEALDTYPDREFVNTVTELLSTANPESLVAAVELMVASARSTTLREELDHEVVLGEYIRSRPNFAEGVRAVLVDKDRNADFTPATTGEVDVTPVRKLLKN